MLIDTLRADYQHRFVLLPPYAWALKFDPNQPRGKGGKWTKGAATEVETCEAGEPGECFRNANKWNTRHGIDTDRVVHGKVTNAEGKTFDHAWIERANGKVVDPTTGVVLPKDQYYTLLHAQPEATYTSREAVRNQIRAMHHGPWTAADLAQKFDPNQPRDEQGKWVKERIATFKAKYPVVAYNFPRSTHTEMGSIEAHTGDVGREWDMQLTSQEMQGISERFGSDVETVMRSAITLHDIGKAEAIESGAGKEAQHRHTIPIMQDVLAQEGFSEKDISLVTELLNHDLIGPLFRGGKASDAEVAAKLTEKAKKVGMNVADFVTLQLAFYQADASAYPYITQYMTQEPSGKWTFTGRHQIRAIEALIRTKKREYVRDEKGQFAETGSVKPDFDPANKETWYNKGGGWHRSNEGDQPFGWGQTPADYTPPTRVHKMVRGGHAGLWGGSHHGSSVITGESAKVMGIEGYNDLDASKEAKAVANQFLKAIAEDTVGSEEALYHSFENVRKTVFKPGDTMQLPLTAAAGAPADYGKRLNQEDQEGAPTYFVFPKGTPMAGYSTITARSLEDIGASSVEEAYKEHGFIWEEAIVAGKFRVVKVETKYMGSQHTYKPTSMEETPQLYGQVVHLEPLEKFDPVTKKWVKLG